MRLARRGRRHRFREGSRARSSVQDYCWPLLPLSLFVREVAAENSQALSGIEYGDHEKEVRQVLTESYQPSTERLPNQFAVVVVVAAPSLHLRARPREQPLVSWSDRGSLSPL